MPQLLSPEEVAVVNHDPGGEQEGIWYLSHALPEWEKGTASSSENRPWVEAKHYPIELGIASNEHLGATCLVRMKVVVEGTRVIKFGLLPALRVMKVKQSGQEIPFIQQGRKEDGSFYAILPAPASAGSEVELTIDYEGDKVIEEEGDGSFAVAARSSWNPSLNSFADRATFDLTFRIPKKYSLVSVGKLDRAGRSRTMRCPIGSLKSRSLWPGSITETSKRYRSTTARRVTALRYGPHRMFPAICRPQRGQWP